MPRNRLVSTLLHRLQKLNLFGELKSVNKYARDELMLRLNLDKL